MEAFFYFDPITREFALFLYGSTPDNTRLGYWPDDDGRLMPHDLSGNKPARPALRGYGMWQQIADAMAQGGVRPSDDAKPTVAAQSAHLVDAIAVRDRLLTIVERKS